MRHVIVRPVAALLTGLFVAGGVTFAWLVGRGPQSPPVAAETRTEVTGEALFARHCASCHRPAALRPLLPDSNGERRRELESFLDGHGDASAEEDALILDYVAAVEGP